MHFPRQTVRALMPRHAIGVNTLEVYPSVIEQKHSPHPESKRALPRFAKP